MVNDRLVLDHVRLQKAPVELINIVKFSKENFNINLAKKIKRPKHF